MPATRSSWSCLFGAVALAWCGNAQAQGIAHVYSDGIVEVGVTRGQVYAGTGDVGVVEEEAFALTPLGFGALTGAFPDGTFEGTVHADEAGCRFTHHHEAGTGFDDSVVVCEMVFWPLADQTARVRWGGERNASTRVELSGGRTAQNLIDETSAAGDVTVLLEKGFEYEFRFLSNAFASPPIDAWGEFVIVRGCNSADIDGNGVLNLDDIEGFVAAFLGGCP